MPTIQQQLNQLKRDKETLNTMLNTMGVETKGDETFTQLAPLVGKIVADSILQEKTITITENGTTTIIADEGYDGLSDVKITTNVENGSEVVVDPDYITDGLIAWFDGEDNVNASKRWVSRVGSDYIYESDSTAPQGSQWNSFGLMKSSDSYVNNMVYSLSTSKDYYVEGYTVEVVCRSNSYVNSTDIGYSRTTGCPIFGIGRTGSVYVGVCGDTEQLRIINVDKALPYAPTGLVGKKFGCTIHFEQAIPRSSTSGTDKVLYSFNGSQYYSVENTLSSITKNDGTCNVLCYYKTGYRANANIYCIRVYNRKLTEEEIAHNHAIDKVRFNIEE